MFSSKKIITAMRGIFSRNIYLDIDQVVTSSTVLTLNESSKSVIVFTGSSAQTVNLGDATNYEHIGKVYTIVNNSSNIISVTNAASTVVAIILPKDTKKVSLLSNSTQNGTWIVDNAGLPVVYSTSSDSSISTNNTAFQNIMSITPIAGSYLVDFSGSMSTAGLNTVAEFRLVLDGNEISGSLRTIRNTTTLLGGLVSLSVNNMSGGFSTSATITVNGSQTITAQYRYVSVSSGSAGSISIAGRTLSAQQINLISS